MSYGSTFAPFEANGRLSSRPQQVKKDFNETSAAKLVRYEKDFDVNLSRIDAQPPDKSSIKASMVAYSKKMKTITESRLASTKNGPGDPLFVRAKHIPKYPVRPPKKRRPMSFDELLGRDRDAPRPTGAKQRPKSDKVKPIRDEEVKSDTAEIHLPVLSERLKKTSSNMHVSLVSASDLYDIVDFSLKSRSSRNDSLRLLRLERELGVGNLGTFKSPNHKTPVSLDSNKPIVPSHDDYAKYERTNEQSNNSKGESVSGSNSPEEFTIPELPDLVPTDSFYKRMFALGPLSPRTTSNLLAREAQEAESKKNGLRLPSLAVGPIKKRPNRAKRMKLFDPGLGDIPEDNIIEMRDNSNGLATESPRVTSPAPKHSPRTVDVSNRRSLAAIQEQSERTHLVETVSQINGTIDRRFGRKDGVSDRVVGASTYDTSTSDITDRFRRNGISPLEDAKVTKKILIRDDGDVRIEVTQCPPKHDGMNNTKLRAQKRFAKKLIYLRDTPR